MTFNAYLKWLAAQIIADTAFLAACTTYFGRAPTAYVGVDDLSLPETAECPLIIITSGGRQFSDGSHRVARSARLCLAIEDAVQSTESDGVVSFRGPERLDELTKLVASAILNSRETTKKFAVEGVTPGPDDECKPPYFKAWLGINISHDSDITIS